MHWLNKKKNYLFSQICKVLKHLLSMGRCECSPLNSLLSSSQVSLHLYSQQWSRTCFQNALFRFVLGTVLEAVGEPDDASNCHITGSMLEATCPVAPFNVIQRVMRWKGIKFSTHHWHGVFLLGHIIVGDFLLWYIVNNMQITIFYSKVPLRLFRIDLKIKL